MHLKFMAWCSDIAAAAATRYSGDIVEKVESNCGNSVAFVASCCDTMAAG